MERQPNIDFIILASRKFLVEESDTIQDDPAETATALDKHAQIA